MSTPIDETTGNPIPPLTSLLQTIRRGLGKLVAPMAFLTAGLLLIVALGIAQRSGWISDTGGNAPAESTAAEQVFTCSMHPQIRQPQQGRCPICGMHLVGATGQGDHLGELSIKIEPAQRRLANIETAAVRREPLSATIQTVGAIAIDESRMATIASYVDGRLERLFADYTGVKVAEQDHLAVIYSPELYSAQVEYLETRKSSRQMGSTALEAIRQSQERLTISLRQRLVELGMADQQIEELVRTEQPESRLTIYAPTGGTVIEKLAMEGKYVKAGEPIYRIADLTTVWLVLELYPEDAARIRFGQRVEAEMQSLPGESFSGRVAFVDPQVDTQRRTVGVRVEFLNDKGRLRPGDYANAKIYFPIGQEGDVYDQDLAGRWISPMHPQIIRDVPGKCEICGMDLVPTSRYGYSDVPVEQPLSLYVPRTALLMAGDNSVVYVETEPGHFEIRPVTIGPILRDKVIVLRGLREGEQVATAGNFLIDSQMQLAGKPSLIDPARALAALPNKPLQLREVAVTPYAGRVGENIEHLYAAYFIVSQALAGDQQPPSQAVLDVHENARGLANETALSAESRQRMQAIVKASEHLHHMELKPAREAFKAISQSVVTLASQVRGERAETPFVHFFCQMVGGGNWLQPHSRLTNPYMGRRMLNCGDKIQEFPVP